MSSTMLIVSGIGAIVVLMLAYAFIYQTVENKRKQQQRILSALKTRATNFKYMLSGFPEHFLTKDLTVLLNRSLIDIYEQISKLDPGDPTYPEAIQTYTGKLAEAQRSQVNSQRVQLSNPQQIKEVSNHLQELHRFVEKLLQRHVINGAQAKTYSKQIQKLILQISVDAYLLQARQAQQGQKLSLAMHYYTLAKKLLMRENSQQAYTKQIKQLEAIIHQIQTQLKEQGKQPAAAQPTQVKSREWDEFEREEEEWKKKTVYD